MMGIARPVFQILFEGLELSVLWSHNLLVGILVTVSSPCGLEDSSGLNVDTNQVCVLLTFDVYD